VGAAAPDGDGAPELRARHRTWTLEPVDGSTRFTWTEVLSLPIPLLGELALLVYRPFLRQLMRGSLGNLQRLVAST